MLRIIGLAAVLAVALASRAEAQQVRSCGPRADIVKQLSGQYEEQTSAIGIADNGALLEILSSPDGKTWTLLFSLPTGISCLIATGQDLQVLPRLAAQLGPPA